MWKTYKCKYNLEIRGNGISMNNSKDLINLIQNNGMPDVDTLMNFVKPMSDEQIYSRIHRIFEKFKTEDVLSGIIEYQFMDLLDELRLSKSELLAGLLVKYKVDNSRYDYLFRDSERLIEYAEKAILAQGFGEMLEEGIKSKDASLDEKKNVEKTILMKTKHIFQRGDAYIDQLINFADKLYTKFDNDIFEAFGFSYTECRNFFIYIFQTYHKTTEEDNKSEMKRIKALGENFDPHTYVMSSIRNGYIYRLYKKNLYELFGEEKTNKIIDYFKIEFGAEVNYRNLNDFNTLYAKPIINFENFIYAPLPLNTLYNLPKLFHYEFISGKKIKKEARDSYTDWRGKVLEELTAEYLTRLLKMNEVYQSLYYYENGERFEADVTAVKNEVIMLCECKSKTLVFDTLTGKLDSLEKDFNAAIGKSYEQASRTEKWLRRGNDFEYEKNGQKIKLNFSKNSKVYKICVVADHFGWIPAGIADYMPNLSQQELPIVINLFDLDIITKECKNFTEFEKYLRARNAYQNKLSSSDELEMFLAIKNNVCEREDAVGKDVIIVDGFTSEIDGKYYEKAFKWLMSVKV